MKLGSSLLFLALTAGLAVVALTGAGLDLESPAETTIDADAWFV